jgi:hypothetical protein
MNPSTAVAALVVPVPVASHRRRRPARKDPLRKRGETPGLPDEAWRLILAHIAGGPFTRHRAPPFVLTIASMVNRQLRRLVAASDTLWYDLVCRHQNAYFDRTKEFMRFAVTSVIPEAPGLHFSPLPDWEAPDHQPHFNYDLPGPGGVDLEWRLTQEQKRAKRRALPAWPNLCLRGAELDDAQWAAALAHGKRLLRMEYVRRCGACGARGKHTPFWGLGFRVCKDCRADRFVSNAALYADYGLDMWLEMDHLAGSVYFYTMSTQGGHRRLAAASFSAHDRRAAAIIAGEMIHPQQLAFFWRPHLEAVFKDLEARARAVRDAQRLAAAARIAAAGRALFTRVAIGQRGHPVSPVTSHLFYMSGPEQRGDADVVALYQPTEFGWYPGQLALGGEKKERARRALQTAFLQHADRLTLPRAIHPARVLGILRRHEAERATANEVALGWYPQVGRASCRIVRSMFNFFRGNAIGGPRPTPDALPEALDSDSETEVEPGAGGGVDAEDGDEDDMGAESE